MEFLGKAPWGNNSAVPFRLGQALPDFVESDWLLMQQHPFLKWIVFAL